MNIHPSKRFALPAWVFQLALVLGLVLGNSGCVSPSIRAKAAAPFSAVAGCQSSKVTITGVHWFKDAQGAWRVVGVITNGSSQAVSKLVTGVETYTRDNQPADQGEDVSAYPLDLQPGAQAPFTAWIDRDIPGLDHFQVEIDECVLAEQEARGRVDVRGNRIVVEAAGTAQVTAELYNPGPEPVLVNGLMAAVYDQSGAMVSAEYVVVGPRNLASGESGPVRASLDLPPGGAGRIKSFQLFMDVLVAQPNAAPPDVPQDVQLLSRYTDQEGQFHLVGQITNHGTRALVACLQATVYADPGRSTVVDAAEWNTWIPLAAGETRFFDLNGWGALDQLHGLSDELDRQKVPIGFRVEPFLTWSTDARVSPLTLLDGSVSVQNQQVVFTGKVRNDLGQSIINGLVMAVVRQKSNGEIVATETAQLAIAASDTPGQILDYSLTVPLPPGMDPAAVEPELTAIGQQP